MHTWTKDMGATYRPGIVGTKPSVIPPVVADGSNPHRRWPGVSPVLSGTHLPTAEWWKAELAKQREEVGRSVDWFLYNRDLRHEKVE